MVRKLGHNGYGGSMSEIVPVTWLERIQSYFDQHGLTEAVGGVEALDEGLKQLAAGALPVAGELIALQAAGDSLADAVYDTLHYPHLVKVHGFINDVLVMDLPGDVLPWARKVTALGAPEGSMQVRRATTRAAVVGTDALAHLARFALFEVLCVRQRLVLMAQGAHLESYNGRRRDIEAISEREVELAQAWEGYGRDLSRVEDPVKALSAAAVLSLQEYVDNLREELRALGREVHEGLEARRRVLEVMDSLPADQAVLVHNECADIFGEEKIEAEDLLQQHPAMLGHLGRDAIYQRVHRLPARIAKLGVEEVDRQRRPSLADLILELSRGGEGGAP
jgi:hypothetical protein